MSEQEKEIKIEKEEEKIEKEEAFSDVDLNEWVKNVSEALVRLANFCNDYVDKISALDDRITVIEDSLDYHVE